MSGGNKKTILLVEDEVIIAMSEKIALEKYDYTVLAVNTGEKAVEAINTNFEISLILMDIDLGSGIDGTQAAEVILEKYGIPIIFVSSHSEREVVEKTEKITSYGYVVKNSSITVLDASIKMAFKLFDSFKKEKEKEEVLRESEARLNAILSSMNDIVFEIDVFGRFEGYYAPPKKELYSQPDFFLGKKYDEILPVNVCIQLQQAIESINSSNAYQEFEYQLSIDNMVQWEHAVITPRYNKLNEIIGVTAVCRDITERKKAEEALRNSEEKYREIVENAPMGIFSRELAGKFQYINPGLKNQLKCKTEKEFLDNYGLISQRWAFPEKYDEFKALLLENKKVYGFENELRLVDGTTKWFALYSFLDASDQFVTGFSLDITERKLAEKLLHESNELLKSTFLSMMDAIFILDAKTVVVDCNSAATEIFGYSREEILGKTTEFLHVNHETLEEFRQYLISGITEKGFLYLPDFKMKQKDGKIFLSEHSVVPLENEQGEKIGWISVVRNITDRKIAEKLLYESNELYRKLTETTIMGVWQVLLDGSTIYMNPAMKNLLEIDNEEIFANRHYYSFFTDESIEIIKKEQLKRSQGVSSIYEVELIGVHGRKRNVIIAGAPVFSIDGKLTSLIGSFIDITAINKVSKGT